MRILDDNLRARACIKCRQYIVIYPNNALNQKHVKKFEEYHRNHTLVTLDLSEVIEEFAIYHTKTLDKEDIKEKDSDKSSNKFQSHDSKNLEIQESTGSID